METHFVYIAWAIILGALSAFSLPLGSAVGLATRPNRLVIGSMSAFGGGALLAALSVELVAPTVNALVEAAGSAEHAEHVRSFLAMLVGAVIGGLLFLMLDQLVNAKGGFLRKHATTLNYLTRQRKQRYAEMLAELSRVEALRGIPPELVYNLVDRIQKEVYSPGQVIFREGEKGDALLIIQEGEIELSEDDQAFKKIGAGEIIGEIALLTGAPRNATATAVTPASALILLKADFETLRTSVPELDRYLRVLASDRIEEIRSIKESKITRAREWSEKAIVALREGAMVPTPLDIKKAREAHSGSPMAIWLGILLDGIPESFIIGTASMAMIMDKMTQTGSVSFGEIIPYTLIAGLFISNFPEALSSSIGMREQGFTNRRILWLWTSLMIMTSLGAGVGCWVGDSLPHVMVVGVEGLAAGAMLTMIASIMLPEAAHIGGSYVSGLSTTLGFLSAIAFKLFE
jgi:zinc transporter ZupT